MRIILRILADVHNVNARYAACSSRKGANLKRIATNTVKHSKGDLHCNIVWLAHQQAPYAVQSTAPFLTSPDNATDTGTALTLLPDEHLQRTQLGTPTYLAA